MAQRTATPKGKTQYSQPKLAIFGEFANLTAGGLGSVIEGMVNSNLMRRA